MVLTSILTPLSQKAQKKTAPKGRNFLKAGEQSDARLELAMEIVVLAKSEGGGTRRRTQQFPWCRSTKETAGRGRERVYLFLIE